MYTTSFPPRRQEFHETLDPRIWNAPAGVLATLAADGTPEVRPLNFVMFQDALWFHGSPHGVLAQRAGLPASFTCWQDAAWIPSYWRHPEQACPATTYYSSCVVRGLLAAVTSRAEKAASLQALMEKYQPEGGYTPLSAEDRLYAGPLDALTVLRLPLSDVSYKAKYGQHLPAAARQRVLEGLVQRGDRTIAELMRSHNEIASPEGFTSDASAMAVDDICGLLQDTYWAWKRSPEIVARNRSQATAQWGYFQAGRLCAYARLDGWWLYDVVVRPDLRGQGIGSALIRHVLSDPRVTSLPRLGLDTRDRERFYERFGFQQVGRGPNGSWVMMRLQG